MLTKLWQSFLNAVNGLRMVWREERNFQTEVVVAVAVTVVAIIFRFSLIESVLLIVAIVLVLAGEILNTALEDLCNKVQPEYDTAIGNIKDIAAGFVLMTSLGALLIGVLVFVHHFTTFL